MIYQKDYILRMIEMIGELVAAILGNIKKGQYKQAEESLEKAYYDFLKEDAAFFRKLPAEDITAELLQKHNYTNGHLEILSELFFAEGELNYSREKYAQSLESFDKSHILLKHIIKETRSFSLEKNEMVALINDRIKSMENLA